MTHMVKTQINLPEDELKALRETAQRLGLSMADLVREAVRRVWLRPDSISAALWLYGMGCPLVPLSSMTHYDDQ